jgi:hypothetical protein
VAQVVGPEFKPLYRKFKKHAQLFWGPLSMTYMSSPTSSEVEADLYWASTLYFKPPNKKDTFIRKPLTAEEAIASGSGKQKTSLFIQKSGLGPDSLQNFAVVENQEYNFEKLYPDT